MDQVFDCVKYAPLVTWLVDFLKRVPWLGSSFKKYPMVAAFVINLAVTYLGGAGASPGHALPVSQIALCVVLAFSTSVATHEVVTNNVEKLFGRPSINPFSA